jgi:hypothetical protein
MQFPQIRLHSAFAQIGMQRSNPVQEIQQVPAELSYKRTPTKMNIERTPGQLEIDQEQAWNQLNLKGPSQLIADNADYARQQAMEAIAETVAEGNQMQAIENKTNAIDAIVTNKVLAPPADFNIAFIPSHGSVKFNYQPTELHIDWQKGRIEFQATPAQVNHQYTPGKTEIYLRQKNRLEIDFVGINVNRTF